MSAMGRKQTLEWPNYISLERTFFRATMEVCSSGGFPLGMRSTQLPKKIRAAAEFARRFSVVGDSEWISAREARQFTWEKLEANPTLAGDILIQHVKLGFVPGRAVLMQMCSPKNPNDWQIEEREWDIPDWFWNGFGEKGSSAQDWAQGKFSGTV